MERQTPASARNNLVPNPLPGRGVGLEHVEKARANGPEGGTANEKRLVVTSGGDGSAARDGSDRYGDDHGQVAHPAHGWGGAVDGLEVDREVVDRREEATTEDKGAGAHNPVGALAEELGRHHGTGPLVPLPDPPHNHDGDEANYKADDDGRVPGVLHAAVLEGEEVRDTGAHDQGHAEGIHLQDLLLQGGLLGGGMLWSLEEEEDDGGREGADREIDVKAPAPRDVVGEGAADEGPNDGGEAIGGAEDAGEDGSLLGWCGETDDSIGSGAETCGADASNGAAGDEGVSRGGRAADDGADFEYEKGDEGGCLEREVLVGFPP